MFEDRRPKNLSDSAVSASSSPAAVWEIIVSTGESIWSDGFYKLCGIPRGEKPSTQLGYKLIHPDYRSMSVEAFRKSVETRRPYELEIEILRRGGSIIRVLMNGKLELKNENPFKLILTFTEIQKRDSKLSAEPANRADDVFNLSSLEYPHELLESLDKIQKSSEKLIEYENIIESSQNPILVIGSDFKVILSNRRFLEVHNFKGKDAAGLPAEILFEPDEYKSVILPNLELCFAGKSSASEQILYCKGEKHYFETTFSPVFSKNGQAVKAVIHQTDRTEKRIAEIELFKSKEKYKNLAAELSESNQLKELLLDILSHDLKNSAWLIGSISEMLINDFPDNEDVQILSNSSKKLVNILHNTSVLSKISVGEKIDISRINLTDIIRHLVDDYKTLLRDSEIAVSFNQIEPIYINSNPIISEIFRNYIDNAIKYASSGKRIAVEIIQNRPLTVVKVKDWGAAIPEDKREIIFERNKRLDKDPKRGSGLGLSIVKKIASALDAEVWAEANTPVGNVFCFSVKSV